VQELYNSWVAKDDCGNITDALLSGNPELKTTTAPTWTTKSRTLNVTVQCSLIRKALTSAQAKFQLQLLIVIVIFPDIVKKPAVHS